MISTFEIFLGLRETKAIAYRKICKCSRPRRTIAALPGESARCKLRLTNPMTENELIQVAIAQARKSLGEGGIPIGSALARAASCSRPDITNGCRRATR